MAVEAAPLTKGQKAKQTRQHNAHARTEARRVAHQDRRQKIIDRYGSEDAARAPANDRERAIIEAGAEYDRRRAAGELPKGEYREADKAWPMPTTYAAALAEQAEWEARDAEFAALDLDEEERRLGLGDSLPTDLSYRAQTITNLVEWEMPLRTVAEIHDRLKRCRDRDEAARARGDRSDSQDLELVADATLRDLGAMVDVERERPDGAGKWPSLAEVARNTAEVVSRRHIG